MKHVLNSRTLWLNLLAFLLLGGEAYFKANLLGVSPIVQAQLLTAINFGLRFVTSQPLTFSTGNPPGTVLLPQDPVIPPSPPVA